ncbi:MAG: amino acid permease [Candidatus Harrisonbacteria bacterium]|nr:amino acid permease [Candidatus Harrisonbacteria bacterium]
MPEIREIGHQPVALARTLGLGSIILLGVGALLGGGIFTLLGPAAGIAGPGLFLSMLLGAGLAFLNLQMYIALGTTFPEAGGGYLWVRKGLGDFQGFLAGWLSWFAHGAAAGLYALSFGYYAYETYKLFGGQLAINILSIEKIAGVAVVIIFGYINWKGAKSSRTTGNIVDGILVGILLLFIGSGIFKILSEPTQSFSQYSPLLPNGFLGIIGAAALFYIAFEGSEIQVQTGEETKNPETTLKSGLIWSWAIVSALYLLVSLIIIGATRDGGPIWEVLGRWGEGAIVKSAQGFMPLGTFLMLIGGLLANLGALNATIYSCSRVAFALARDKNVWSHLANIHLKNLSPHIAVIFSAVLIALMVIFLPLLDVAALASLLFILLFLQLNIAGIKIHYKWPNTQWAYKVPLFPLLPLIAIIAYALLALTMLKINLNAWVISIFWLLLGLINYLSYAKTQSREDFEKEIVYEESVRVGPKTGRRILMPIAPELTLEELKNLSEIAFALASNLGGEIIAIKVHQVPQPLALLDGATMTHDRQIFQNLKEWVAEFNEKMPGRKKDVNLHNFLLVGRDIVETILDVIKMEDCDLLLLNWEGYTKTKGTIFGSKIDRILRESKCDLLVVKNPRPITSLMMAAHPAGDSPYLKLMGEIFLALKNYYKPKTELISILGAETPLYLKPDPQILLKPLGLKKKDYDEVEFFKAKSVVTAIIDEAKTKEASLIIIGASRPKILGEIRFGNIPELLAKHLDTSLMIVRGHQGIAEALWEKLIKKISGAALTTEKE